MGHVVFYSGRREDFQAVQYGSLCLRDLQVRSTAPEMRLSRIPRNLCRPAALAFVLTSVISKGKTNRTSCVLISSDVSRIKFPHYPIAMR